MVIFQDLVYKFKPRLRRWMALDNGGWNLANDAVALACCACSQDDNEILELGIAWRGFDGMLQRVDGQGQQGVDKRVWLTKSHFVEIGLTADKVVKYLS